MSKYNVHLFAVTRVKVKNVEAESQSEAVKKAQEEVDLPMPRKEGKFWVWTKEQAEAWRQWYAEGKPEKEEVDV